MFTGLGSSDEIISIDVPILPGFPIILQTNLLGAVGDANAPGGSAVDVLNTAALEKDAGLGIVSVALFE